MSMDVPTNGDDAVDYTAYLYKAVSMPRSPDWHPAPGERVFIDHIMKSGHRCVIAGVVIDTPMQKKCVYFKDGKRVFGKTEVYKVFVVRKNFSVRSAKGRAQITRLIRVIPLESLRPAPQQISRKHLLKLCLDSLYTDCVV